jgi:hypothetical protein
MLQGTASRTTRLNIPCSFPVVWCPGFLAWHHCLRIWALLSVIRSLAAAALPWMLDLWSSCRTVFVDTGSSRWIFSFYCNLCSSTSVIFKTIHLNVRRSHSVSVDFRPLFLFADVVYPWFVYADKTLETVALDTRNNVAGFITCSSQTRTNYLSSCKMRGAPHPIFRFFQTDRHSTQSLVHCHEHCRV